MYRPPNIPLVPNIFTIDANPCRTAGIKVEKVVTILKVFNKYYI